MQKSIKCLCGVLQFYYCSVFSATVRSNSNFSVFFRQAGCELLFVFNCSLSWKPFRAIKINGSFVYLLFILLTGGKKMLKMKRLFGDGCLNTELQMQHN